MPCQISFAQILLKCSIGVLALILKQNFKNWHPLEIFSPKVNDRTKINAMLPNKK
jgi:hypothetical protein